MLYQRARVAASFLDPGQAICDRHQGDSTAILVINKDGQPIGRAALQELLSRMDRQNERIVPIWSSRSAALGS